MTKYKLLIKFNNLSNLHRESYLSYESNYHNDSGFDLVCPDSIYDNSTNIGTINFQICCAMIDTTTNELTGYYLYPRSSLSKHPLMLANHVGIIDAGYRGNIMAKVRYLPFITNEPNYKIDEGIRLFQICAPDLSPFKIEIVNELPSSQRGEEGFGSTGL